MKTGHLSFWPEDLLSHLKTHLIEQKQIDSINGYLEHASLQNSVTRVGRNRFFESCMLLLYLMHASLQNRLHLHFNLMYK